MKHRILIVDDHAMTRGGLRQVLSRKMELEVVGEAATGAAALKLAGELKPDLVLMDVQLPDSSGIEVTRELLELHPDVKVIMFSGATARSVVDEALAAGASGYLSKAGEVDELVSAVETVLAGRLYLSPEVCGEILMDYKRSLLEESEAKKSLLSDLEKHILRLIVEGRRNKEIADACKITTKAVEAHRSRMMKKAGCATPAELVRYAIREGIAQL
jgi:DNA-binding NarL/FixJ family response regulator